MSESVNKILAVNATDRNMKFRAVKKWYDSLPWNKRSDAKKNMKEFHKATKAYKGQR